MTAEGEEPISVGGLIDTIGNATYDVLLLGHDLLQKTLTSEGCVEDDGSWQLPDSARASGLAQQLEVEYAQLPDEERAAARVAGAGTGAVPASCTHGSPERPNSSISPLVSCSYTAAALHSTPQLCRAATACRSERVTQRAWHMRELQRTQRRGL